MKSMRNQLIEAKTHYYIYKATDTCETDFKSKNFFFFFEITSIVY